MSFLNTMSPVVSNRRQCKVYLARGLLCVSFIEMTSIHSFDVYMNVPGVIM
jgi:hypothetical protein